MLARVLRTVDASSVAETVLVLGFAAERAGELTLPPKSRLKVVVNSRYREGMASSLQAGLAALDRQTEAALIVLADQPLVRPETLDQIAGEFLRSGRQIVIPVYKGARGNPVLIGRRLFPEIMALTGDRGARAIFSKHGEEIIRLRVEDRGILLDVDSRRDFEELERWERAGEEERAEIEAAALDRRGRSEDQ
jgi:molybdenum cofactor cytidylyltransferase